MGNITINAGQNINLSGSRLASAQDLSLTAGKDINLLQATDTAATSAYEQKLRVGRDLTVASLQDSSSASSSSYSVGGGFTVGYGANWDPFKSVDGAKISTAGGLEGYGETMAKALEQVLNDRKPAGLDPSQSLKENMGGAADSIFNKGQQNPSGKYKEQYQANVGGSIAEGQSKTVGEQTSILGSESVNIYTEGNTHVAGAIIAALNDNLKLDTGSLSYENLIGKTTGTSTSAGINWTYSPAQKGDKGKKEELEQPSDVNMGKTDSSSQTSVINEVEKRGQDEQRKEEEFYKNTPAWLETIMKIQTPLKNWWKDKKENALYGITPGKFSYGYTENIQTAYATIGKGKIIVRNNPGQSLDGLNRDPSQAMKTEKTTDVNIELKPAFDYVDDFLNLWGGPIALKKTIDFFVDPKEFLKDMQDNLAKSMPFLKRPTPKVNPITPVTDDPVTSSSVPDPQPL